MKTTTGTKIALAFVGVISLVFIGYQMTFAAIPPTASGAALFPTAATRVPALAHSNWHDEEKVYSTDTQSAHVNLSSVWGTDKSELLRATGFNFNIPTGATITGVTATIIRKGDFKADTIVHHRHGPDTIDPGYSDEDLTVRLVKGTSHTASDNRATTNAWSTTLTPVSYGGVSDRWGYSNLTREEINSSNFGLELAVQHIGDGGSSKPEVDSISLAVTYTMPDTTAPVITMLDTSPVTVAQGSTYTDAGATASDNVDGDVTSKIVTTNLVNTSMVGDYTVTYNVSDVALNPATPVVRTVHVTDQTKPVVTIDSILPVEATSKDGAIVDFGSAVHVTDNVDKGLTSTCTPASGTQFGFGVTTVTCTATDAAGNLSLPVTTSVTVQDTTKPTITLIGKSNIALTTLDTFTDEGATASDNVDGDITSSIVKTGSVTEHTVGTYTLTYTVTDAHGNTASVDRTVSISDVDGPTISGTPDDITVEAMGPKGSFVEYNLPTAVDAEGTALEVSCTPASGDIFEIGKTTVTCSATDAAGKIANSSFTVTVQDTTAPTVHISLPPQPVEAASSTGAIVDFDSFASDFMRAFKKVRIDEEGDQLPLPPSEFGELKTLCTPESGSWFALGTTTVTCLATDFSGNVGSSTADVIVVDTTAPTITAPMDQTFEATGTSTTPTLVQATATDLVDLNPAITYDAHDFKVGTTTVTWTVIDFSGNASTATSLVTIADTTAPVVTLLGDASMTLTVGGTFTDPGATARDIADGDVKVVVGGNVDTATVGTYTLTYDAADTAGNKAEQVKRTVMVNAAPQAPASNGGGNGGGGGVISGPLSFGYVNNPPQPPLPPATTENEHQEGTNDGDNGNNNGNGDNTGVAGAQALGNGGANPLTGAGTPQGQLNGATQARGTGSPASSHGTTTPKIAGTSSDNGQAAAVALAGSGWHFPAWAQFLALLAVLAGFGFWFFLYRRKNA